MMAHAHRLTNVEVERFKSFRSAAIDVGDLTVLIGPNGSGKSNFLELFDMIGSILDERLGTWAGQRGGADRILHNGVRGSESLHVKLEFAGGRQGYEAEIRAAAGGGVFFADEQAWGTGATYDKAFTVNLGSGHSETALLKEVKEHPSGVTAWTLDCLSGWQRYHFHDTSRTAPVKQPHPVGDNRFLRRDGSNLAAFLYALKENGDPALDRIRDALRSVAPFFDDFVLEPQAVRDDLIQLEWTHRDSDMYADATTLSDGSLRFLCLATVLLQPDPPALILIDEPELGLHPFAINQLAELLYSMSARAQVIVSTQSVTLLDRIELEDVVIAERNDARTDLTRLDREALTEWLELYSVGELWLKNLIGARPQRA